MYVHRTRKRTKERKNRATNVGSQVRRHCRIWLIHFTFHLFEFCDFCKHFNWIVNACGWAQCVDCMCKIVHKRTSNTIFTIFGFLFLLFSLVKKKNVFSTLFHFVLLFFFFSLDFRFLFRYYTFYANKTSISLCMYILFYEYTENEIWLMKFLNKSNVAFHLNFNSFKCSHTSNKFHKSHLANMSFMKLLAALDNQQRLNQL